MKRSGSHDSALNVERLVPQTVALNELATDRASDLKARLCAAKQGAKQDGRIVCQHLGAAKIPHLVRPLARNLLTAWILLASKRLEERLLLL